MKVVYFLILSGLLFVLISASMPQTWAADDETRQPDGTLRRIRVPILMYHYVSELPPDADRYREELTLSPDLLREQLAYLWSAGYQTISLLDLHAALLYGDPLPARPIILTFDDGYRDHYTNAFPLLRQFEYTGTFFVITQRADEGHPAYLTWDQIEAMAAAGMDMQSHSRTHPDLRNRSPAFLIYEILGSIESLEAHTGQPVHAFSYPAGRYDGSTLNIVEQLPINIAVTTQTGVYHTNDNLLELKRLRVTPRMGRDGLAQLLANAN